MSIWRDLCRVDATRFTVFGVNSAITTNINIDHAVMGDGDHLEAMLWVRSKGAPATHTISPAKSSADYVWDIPREIRTGGSGMYAAWIALHGMGFDKAYMAGFDLHGGYFHDPLNDFGQAAAHEGLRRVWLSTSEMWEAKIIGLSGWMAETFGEIDDD